MTICVLCGAEIKTWEGQRTCSLAVAIEVYGAHNGPRAAGSPSHDECHGLIARGIAERAVRLAG